MIYRVDTTNVRATFKIRLMLEQFFLSSSSSSDLNNTK